MESESVTYQLSRTILIENDASVLSTARTIKSFLCQQRLRSKVAMTFMIANMLSILAFPTLMSAMSGYDSNVFSRILDRDNNLIAFSSVASTAFFMSFMMVGESIWPGITGLWKTYRRVGYSLESALTRHKTDKPPQVIPCWDHTLFVRGQENAPTQHLSRNVRPLADELCTNRLIHIDRCWGLWNWWKTEPDYDISISDLQYQHHGERTISEHISVQKRQSI